MASLQGVRRGGGGGGGASARESAAVSVRSTPYLAGDPGRQRGRAGRRAAGRSARRQRWKVAELSAGPGGGGRTERQPEVAAPADIQ